VPLTHENHEPVQSCVNRGVGTSVGVGVAMVSDVGTISVTIVVVTGFSAVEQAETRKIIRKNE